MQSILVTHPRPGIVQINLHRPDRMNAMNADLVAGLHAALDEAAAERDCRVVVLTGSGKAFCAGLDLGGYGTVPGQHGLRPVPAGMATQQHIASLVPHLRSLPVPVIAAVNGAASGGGMALALGCDVRIAATAARFNVAFVKVGLSGCDIGLSWLLPRLIGASRAWELMLTGRMVDASEAARIGLVTRSVRNEELLESAYETAGLIIENSPWGVRMTKEVAWSQLEIGSLQAGIDMENRTQLLSSHTGDMQEAVAAFRDKRRPKFET